MSSKYAKISAPVGTLSRIRHNAACSARQNNVGVSASPLFPSVSLQNRVRMSVVIPPQKFRLDAVPLSDEG
eukprot:5674767-Pyramimonas_sp.AAC.1